MTAPVTDEMRARAAWLFEQILSVAEDRKSQPWSKNVWDEDVALIRQALSPVVPVDKWRTMDTAPMDGTPILVCNDLYTKNGFLPLAVRWRTYHPNAQGDPCWRDTKGHKVERINWWQPLPSPPKETT